MAVLAFIVHNIINLLYVFDGYIRFYFKIGEFPFILLAWSINYYNIIQMVSSATLVISKVVSCFVTLQYLMLFKHFSKNYPVFWIEV